MEHLIYLHDAEVYQIVKGNKEEILKPCEECGKQDLIYLSWEEDKREEVLDKFLIGYKRKSLDVTKALKDGQNIDDLVLGTHIYFELTREIINGLYKTGSITKEKQMELLKENKKTEKNQLLKIKKDTKKYVLKRIFNIKNKQM